MGSIEEMQLIWSTIKERWESEKQALFGLRARHSGVTYAAVMPPSMIND